MRKYHGTPVGGNRVDPARFLRGRDALIPHARPDDLAIVLDVCRSWIGDNSAFRYWKTGERVDFDAYADWIKSIYRHPGYEWCLIPDVIDGTEEENARLIHLWVRNGGKFKGVPVWHLHESLEWLEWLVERFEWVALGSSGQWRTPGTTAWWQRMSEVRPVVCDSHGRPKCKLHGLRMLDPDIFTRIPFASADSTNATVNSGSISRFGMYKPPTAAQRAEVIASIIEAQNSPAVWLPAGQQQSIELTLTESGVACG